MFFALAMIMQWPYWVINDEASITAFHYTPTAAEQHAHVTCGHAANLPCLRLDLVCFHVALFSSALQQHWYIRNHQYFYHIYSILFIFYHNIQYSKLVVVPGTWWNMGCHWCCALQSWATACMSHSEHIREWQGSIIMVK